MTLKGDCYAANRKLYGRKSLPQKEEGRCSRRYSGDVQAFTLCQISRLPSYSEFGGGSGTGVNEEKVISDYTLNPILTIPNKAFNLEDFRW